MRRSRPADRRARAWACQPYCCRARTCSGRRHLLRLRAGSSGPVDRVGPALRQLLQHILLIGRRRDGRSRDQRQRDADAFVVGEEEELVLADRPADADAEFVHGRARLLGDVAGRVVGMEEVVGGVQQRAVPYLVRVAVKLVRPRLGEVVDLRRAVAALIDRIGVGVHGGLLQRVQADDEIRGEPDIQSEERIVRVVAVEDVAVRGRGQPVELDIAVAAGSLGVVRRACRIHQCALGKLRDIGEVLAGVGQALDGLGFERGGCIRVFEAHQPGLRDDFDRL